MVEHRKYIVRDAKSTKGDYKESFRVHLSTTALRYHGLKPGDLCHLSTSTHLQYLATAWHSPDINDTIIQTPKTLQTLCDLKLGDRVTLSRSSNSTRHAHIVIISEIGDSGGASSLPDVDSSDTVGWSWRLKHELKKAAYLCPGMIFARVWANDEERTFRIVSVDGSADKILYDTASLRSVVICTDTGRCSERSGNYEIGLHNLNVSHVGGLEAQLSQLNSTITAYGPAAGRHKTWVNQPSPREGIILHGPAGTGKSMLLGVLAEAGWRGVFRIKKAVGSARVDDTEKAIHNIFVEARRLQPSIIIIDDLDTIAGKNDIADNPLSVNMAGRLCQAFDELSDERVLVVAATRKLAAIDGSLRCPGRFETDLEIPVPGTDARAEILNIIVGLPKGAQDRQLLQLANRTHGYVGSDLNGLVRAALKKADLRRQGLNGGKADYRDPIVGDELLVFPEGVTEDEIEAALLEIRPTAMKEVFLDTPNVRWGQIGGQAEVKKALTKAVEWPLKVSS